MNPGGIVCAPQTTRLGGRTAFQFPERSRRPRRGLGTGRGGSGSAGPPGCNERQTAEFRGGLGSSGGGCGGWVIFCRVEGEQLAGVVEDLNPGRGGL